jgi:hypothetical protein
LTHASPLKAQGRCSQPPKARSAPGRPGSAEDPGLFPVGAFGLWMMAVDGNG